MSKHIPSETSHVTADAPTRNRDLRWPRLVANSIWIVVCFALGSFVSDLIGSIWNHNFKADVLSTHVFWWLGKAVAVGLFFGLFMGFFTWLAQEIFGRETNSSRRTGG